MSRMSTQDLHWLAGLVEGEGSFGAYVMGKKCPHPQPRMRISMTDQDVIWRAARLLKKAPCPWSRKDKRGYKDQWQVELSGAQAIGWMMTLYPLMGIRRKGQIRTAITAWKKKILKPGDIKRAVLYAARAALKADTFLATQWSGG